MSSDSERRFSQFEVEEIVKERVKTLRAERDMLRQHNADLRTAIDTLGALSSSVTNNDDWFYSPDEEAEFSLRMYDLASRYCAEIVQKHEFMSPNLTSPVTGIAYRLNITTHYLGLFSDLIGRKHSTFLTEGETWPTTFQRLIEAYDQTPKRELWRRPLGTILDEGMKLMLESGRRSVRNKHAENEFRKKHNPDDSDNQDGE